MNEEFEETMVRVNVYVKRSGAVATETGVWALHEGSFHPIRFVGEKT